MKMMRTMTMTKPILWVINMVTIYPRMHLVLAILQQLPLLLLVLPPVLEGMCIIISVPIPCFDLPPVAAAVGVG